MESRRGDPLVETGAIPLDIDDVHMLLQVEQEQIQKRTFTNWINAQLAKRKPPCAVLDLFNDFRDGSRLLDLLEVMSGQHMSRERGRGVFQHRSNIETALAFLRRKSIKLVNINIPDIMDGKPSIILGLIWMIILHFHIEELACTLSFSSRQSSLESLASLDSHSTSSRSTSSSPLPRRGSPLHTRFRISAKKALLLWVREQLHKVGCTLSVKDFKASWRSGVVFLAILCALRPDLVDLSKARNRSNKQNLEEAFRMAEQELRIPKLLEPEDVDVRDPDEKSIMTYVAQFLQYSQDLPISEEEMQVHSLTPPCVSPVNLPTHFTPAISASPLRQTSVSQKAREVTCWLVQAYQELIEGWASTEGESYAERYHVFQTFVVSFNEQRRPVMPLLTAMRRSPQLSEDQRALRRAWDSLAEKLREYKTELDLSLPAPLDAVGTWLLRVEGALTDEDKDTKDHAQAAEDAREKLELLKTSMEEMSHQLKTFNSFLNMDEYGAILVPTDKMEEIKRRFTSVRVTAKYHGIKLEYQEHRHTVLDLLGQINNKLRSWKRPYWSQEGVRLLLQDWHDAVDKQDLVSLLEAALVKLKIIANKYTSKSALAADSQHIIQQMKSLEGETAASLEAVSSVKSTMGRVLSAWDSYCDCLSSLQAWLYQESQSHTHSQRAEMTPECLSEWTAHQAHLNEVGNFLTKMTAPQISRVLADEMRKVNMQWADFVKRTKFTLSLEPSSSPPSPQAVQALFREAGQLLKEPIEVLSGPLHTYRKRLQFMMKKIKEVDFDSLSQSPDCSSEILQKLKHTLPEVMLTLGGAEQVCEELQQSVSGLNSRLAELQHCETEAREVYQLLKEEWKYGQNQDPRARMFISRGLQLEGQVVTEEQDLQVMVMTAQKNSPLQYLIASAMQDRVRAAVSHSQEAVGMLSSLGARRDRSPAEDQPPPKIFIQSFTEDEPQSQADVKAQTVSEAQAVTEPQALVEPWVMPETHPQEQPKPPTQPKPTEQHRPDPKPLTDPQPPPEPQMQTQSQVLSHPAELAKCQVQPQPRPKTQPQSTSLPQGQPYPHPLPQIHIQDYTESQPQLPAFTYAQAVTQSLPQSQQPSQHKIESQVQTPAHTPVYSQAVSKSLAYNQDEVQTKTKAPVQSVSQTQAHMITQDQSQSQPQIKPPVLTETNVQSFTQALPLASVHEHHSQVTAQSKAQKLQSRAKNRPWLQKKAQIQTQTQSKPVVEEKVQPQPLVHTQTQFQVQPQAQTQTQAQAHSQAQAQAHVQVQPQPWAQTQPQVQFHPNAVIQTQIQVQPQSWAHTQTQVQSQHQTHTLGQAKMQPQPGIHTQTQVQVHPHAQTHTLGQAKMQPQPGIHTQTQVKVHSQAQSQDQNEGQPRTGIHTQAQVKVHSQAQSQSLVKPQPSAQVQTEAKVQPYPLSQPQPEIQYQPWNQTQAQTAPISTNFIQVNPQPWSPAQPKAFPQSYPQTHRQIQPHPWAQNQVQTPPQAQAQIQPQPWSYTETQDQIPPQAQAKVQPKPGVHTQTQIQVQPQAQTQVQVQTWAHSKTELPPQVYSQTQAQIQPHPKSQDEPLQQPATRTKAPALAQAPPQAYTEAYSKAQALARDRFEEAKHCLQDHILEAITIFNDKQISEEQLGEKEETFKSLDPELLEEFLRAAEGMEAFCTVAQLRDMEFFTESVRTQWEACFSSERSLAQAGQQLGALKELCDTLSPEDAHRLAQAQLQECERRLAAIQRQFSGDRDTPPPGTGHPVELAKDEAVRSQSAVLLAAPHDRASPQVSQVIVGAGTIEVKKVEKILIEDEAARKDALDRYRDSKSIFQAQLAKTKPSLQSFPSDAVSPADLHIQLQELEALKKETQRLWSEFALQGSKCSQFEGEECSVEKDKTELMQQWQTHQICLQGRIKSLQTAVGLIDPMEKQISHISERLDNFIKKPKDITAFSLTDSHCLQDIKGLEEDIQHEMSQLGRLDHEDSPDLSELDPEDRLPLSCMALACRQTLDHLRQQVKKSEAATRALDRFLMSLRTVEQDITGTRAAPCEDADVLRECRSRLGQIRQSVHSMGDKAPQLDRLLQGAGLSVTQDGAHVSCLDMVSALERRLEEADAGLARQQQGVQREQDMRSLGLRKRTLLGALRKLQDGAEHQGLKEPTMPAVQHRMRALTDLESRLTAHHTELLALQHAANADDQEELESQWEDSHRAVTEGLEQCRALMELLKKFQNCRSRLNNTLQRAEQTISEQASYMGKDNLQRLITTVIGIKEDLGGLGEGVEEIRGVCRQLQSQLKKIPECRDAPFESEADALVDRWLDVTEKTDSYMDNLHVGLELWDKLQLLGGEVDSWMGKKLSMFAERHPFQTEEEVMALQDEIQSQEENIERFHRKSIEIQELLQSKESPLELQVMETQLRKKMEQVKELFADSSDVFQELMAVRQHIAERMAGCQSSLEAIQAAMNTLSASENPQLPNQIQELAMRLQAEAEQADSLLKEINLMSSVASPQALQTLTAEGARLKESVHTTQELISQKKEQVERGFLRVIKDECQAFEEWFQDLQLSVNECFENPERRQDVEASMQKLTAFLEYKEGERRLGRLKERVARAGEQLSLEQLDPLNMWLQEQEEELTTFRAHCQERRNHLEACLRTINSLQDEYSHLKAWLQDRELKSVQGEELHHLHEEVRKESERMEGLTDLVAAVRRQGLRSDGLVRESDDMLQRYHSLQARLIRQTEAQSALARESQEFEAQAESIKVWIRDLQQQLNSLEKGTEGSQAEVEDRLQKVQALLSARSEGDSKLQYLRQRGQTLSQQRDLEESRRGGVLQALRESEEQWRALMQSAEELCRMLQGVVDRLMSCIYQKQQAQARVEQLQQQMEELPQRFPWPGLGDRRLAMEHALSLLNRIQALTPTVSALQAQGKELFQLTQDPSWIDPSWAALEECAPRLVKDLSDTCRRLEAGIQTERHCDQLVEQHNAALHWLQEQVQGLGPVSSDRADLQSTVNTLKALLQTTDREEREMRELDTVKVSLLGLCDPSGQAALEQEVSRMQECRVHLETEARNRLQDCEARLRELEEEQDRRAQQLREEARGLQRELHSLGQRMMYCSQQADIGHLRDQWHTLKSCEGPLQELGQRIQDLQQAQGSAATEEPLPNDVISTMAAVIEEHCRLNAQLSERVGCCAEDTERSLRQCLEAVQQWNKSTHTQLSTGSSHTIQAALEEGQRLRNILEDALSHSGFLKDSLGQEQMDQLGTDSADALSTNAAHISSLTQTIQDIAEKKKHVTHGCVSEGPISATEQQLKMSLADIQVDKYKPQICHRIEEEDKVGFQSEMTPHDSKEEVLRKQDAYPSSWPTEPSIDDKATNQMQVGQHYPNTEMLVGHQPDSLMKHDKETPTEMQHSVPQQKEIQCTELLLNTAVKTELMGEKVVTVILDTDVQQIQVRGSTNQLVQPPLRENTEYRNTGNTDALTFKVQQIQPPQKENNEATVLHRDGFEIHRDATKLSASDKKQTEILSSKKQDGDLSYTIMIETEKKDEGKHWDIPDTLDTKREVAACDVPKVHSQSSEEQHQDKPKGFNTDSLDSRTEHTNIPGISGDREEHESREALQSNKMAIVILDTDILHIHTPDPWQSKSSDMLRIVSSGTGGFDTTWTPSTEGEDAKIQPSDIAQQETTWSGYTVKHRCTSPHKATEDTVAQPNERQPTDVVQLSKMLDTEVLKMEEHHCEQIPIQSQPVEPEGDKMIQDQTFTGLIELLREEATNYQEKQRRYLVLDLPEVAEAHKTVAELPVVPDRIQDHEAHPKQKQEELTDTTHLEAGESERNMQTTELQRGESERMKNAYVTQLEREPSSQMMQTDATQSEARRPGTPETLRPPVLAAAEDRITQLQKSETVEDKVPEHIKRRDSAQQHEQTPKVEGEHADTPKALDPEARNETEAKRDLLPLVNTAQTEPEPCTSDTVGKLKEDKVDRDMERPKSPQREEDLAWSKTTQKGTEEGDSEAEAAARSKDLPLEMPHGPTMQETFSEIQQLLEKGPSNFVFGVKPPGEAVGNLDTSHRDLETRLSHVVLRILSCRNQPAQLNAIAMIQQVQEAEECRQCAQEHIAAFSRMYEVKGQDQETTQNMEGQWSAALWDGSATVHAKESQLQLVTQYHRQTLAAKATLEKLVAKLEELRNGPVESSLLEAEKLHAVLRDLEQERAVIGELLQTQTKLSPHLSQAERVMSHTQLGHLQEEWRVLERVAEKMLHHVSVTNQETGGLLLEVQELQSQLKTLQKSLGPAQPSEEQWDSQRAEQLMIIGAALKAANQNYLHLQQQTSDAHSQSLQGEKERGDIEQALLHVKEQLESLQRQVSTQSPSSSNATVGKIMKVMQDAFIWAKQKESNIEARKKVALLPEAVHSQIKGLKKLQSEISSKQSQLESLVEEVRELIPELDKKDVPMVLNSLKTLEGLSKSTSEKLAQALQEMESGLQVREKMSEQIADVDSWVVAHVHKETIRESNGKSSTLDLERKLRQLQETLKEADKQAAVTEALLMRSRDIAPELSIAENCLLNDKLTSLHEDIKGIINYEKTNSQELEELLLAQDSSFKKVSSVESILRQVSVDLNRFRFPITKDSLSAVEKVEHVILEQKCQVDQLRQYKEDKSRELLCTIAEMQNKVNALSQKAEQHERYLSYRQHVEDLKVDVEAQVLKMKDENIRKEERYKNCQALLIQLPLIKSLCQAAAVELEDISRDLYPSQLSSERQRLRQVTESLSTWEMTVQNDSNILEWALLKNLHYPTERKAMVEFLKQANLELDKPTKVGLEEQAIDREFLKWATLQRNVDCRTRVLEFLEHSTEARQKGWEQENTDMADLRRKTVNGCTKRMEYLSQAKEILRVYNTAVRGAVRFLQEVESRLLLPLDCAGSCPEQLKHTQQALAFLNEKFQSHITEIHALLPQHTCLSSYDAEQLHSTILSQLLVRISTLQAQAQVRMETFQRCAKKQRVYRRCHKEICQHLNTVETTLSECITHNATSYRACLDQQEKLEVLVHELKSLAERLEELGEWCPEQGCSGGREEAVSALWRLWARLQRCAHYLKARSDQRGAEWKDITKSVERATIILDQLQDELPDCTREKASLDELQEMLVYTEQYQDRLDCEHRSLMALELRVARLLGVPAHQEHSPPIPLCQELQTMQGRYKNLKEKSMLGQQAVQLEVQERERVKEEISGVKEWLVAAVSLLSVMEDLPSTEELQEVQTQLGSQKAVLQSIMDGLRMKYSDMYTLVPIEIDGPLQEVTRSLKEVEEKVGEAVEKSGPLCRLGGRVEEIRLGLQSVLALLEQRSLTTAEAESKQKRLWDELDGWHSRMAALEVEVHDIAEEHPEEAHILTDKLMETRELYQHVAKQAEQRTAFLSRIHTCLQEHEEMIKSSSSWLSEAHAWLTAPCTFTTAKCLSSHASALQMVLEDSEQMRRTLQGFVAVLQDVSSVCDMTALQEQLAQADQRVAIMQESIAAQLSQFQHAAAEVDAIETEVERMEKNLNKFRDILSSEDSTPQSTEEHLRNMQMILGDIESMKRIMAEIQSCKPGLGLPEEAEETMTTFQRAEHLLEQIRALGQMINEQNPTVKQDISQSVEPEKLSTLEEVIESSPALPTLSIPGELQLTTGQSVEPEKLSTSASEEVIVPSPTLPSLSIPGELQLTIGQSVESGELPPSASEEVIVPSPTLSIPGELQTDTEEGRIQIVHVEEDVLKRSGAALLTVQGSSPAQRESWGSERTTQDPDEILIGEEQTGVSSASLEQSLERDEVFQPHPDSAAQDIVGITLTEGASVTAEDLSKPVATVRTQALPQSMVNKSPSVNLSKTSTKPQQKCTIS